MLMIKVISLLLQFHDFWIEMALATTHVVHSFNLTNVQHVVIKQKHIPTIGE
jgi:hypothetical protein